MSFASLAQCQDLWVTFTNPVTGSQTQSLRGVDIAIEEGQIISVVGPSGSGKSTLLHTLAGFQQVTRGTVRLLGREITAMSASRIARLHREGIGFIFQSYNLIGSLTSLENILLPARFGHAPVDVNRARQVLERLGIEHRADQRVADLSGGEQQRVAVGRVLYNRPRLVFADEPTGALDSQSSALVIGLLQQLAHEGGSVLLVTHDLDEAAHADSALILRDGAVQEHLIHPEKDKIWSVMKKELSHV